MQTCFVFFPHPKFMISVLFLWELIRHWICILITFCFVSCREEAKEIRSRSSENKMATTSVDVPDNIKR
jgi:hypothetical protein